MAARRVTRRVWRSSGGRAAGPGERAPPPLLHPAPLPSPAPPPDGRALRGPAAGAESGLLAAFMSHRSLRAGRGRPGLAPLGRFRFPRPAVPCARGGRHMRGVCGPVHLPRRRSLAMSRLAGGSGRSLSQLRTKRLVAMGTGAKVNCVFA